MSSDAPKDGIVIVEYGMGNIGSILNMLKRVGARARSSADPEVIGRARKLILPGVGAFDSGMRHLQASGLIEPLHRKVIGERTPVLGICLGMELLTDASEEGDLPGLGWIPGRTVRFKLDDRPELSVPHMGWNSVSPCSESMLFHGLNEPRFYFAHSYHIVCEDSRDLAGTTEHGYLFPAAVQRGHIAGTQFHPEKSHRYGMQLLTNFVERF